MCYTLVHAEADPAVQSKSPLGNLHTGSLPNSCPGHCPSHQPLSSLSTLGLGNEEVRCCFSSFSLVTQEAGVCQGSKLAFAGFPWAGHCMRYFPKFSCDYLSLKPGRFLSFLVCLLFLPSRRSHIAASSQTQSPSLSGPFRLSRHLQGPAGQWTLFLPAHSRCSSPAPTSSPVSQFPPYLWEVIYLFSTKHSKFSTRTAF